MELRLRQRLAELGREITQATPLADQRIALQHAVESRTTKVATAQRKTKHAAMTAEYTAVKAAKSSLAEAESKLAEIGA